jgi:hypothetical protein
VASAQPTWQPHEEHGQLTTRSPLPDTVFAFPKQRKEPLTDASHVRNAVARFDQVIDVSDADREVAFANIEKAARFYDVDLSETDWHQLGVHPQPDREERRANAHAQRRSRGSSSKRCGDAGAARDCRGSSQEGSSNPPPRARRRPRRQLGSPRGRAHSAPATPSALKQSASPACPLSVRCCQPTGPYNGSPSWGFAGGIGCVAARRPSAAVPVLSCPCMVGACWKV